jgi:adenine-specific DNA-methyltransferase
MINPPGTVRGTTLVGLARAFRRWSTTVDVAVTPDVSGADTDELKRLAALGGIAASVAGSATTSWHPSLRGWAAAAPRPPDELVDATCLALGQHDDPLATLYNASISAAHRRRLGTVFTPPALVDYMLLQAEHELGRPPRVVIDAGAGVGAFTIAAARRWTNARVVAVDINVVTLGLLASRIAFEADAEPELAPRLRRVELVLGDYLDQLRALFEERGPVLALGNPPYTRVQALPSEERTKASLAAGELIDSGHANLAMLFQAATVRHLRPDDASCMLLPGSFSYTRASRALRSFLWKSRRSILVHRAPATMKVFSGRSVQAAVLLVGRQRKRRMPMGMARVDVSDRVKVLEEWTLPRGDDEPENWFWAPTTAMAGSELTLGDVAVVRRGAATGANSVFFLGDEDAAPLPRDVLVPALVNLKGFDGEEIDTAAHARHGDLSTKRWLLAVPAEYEQPAALTNYLERHRDHAMTRHLVQKRKPWYSITELPRPHLLISPLSKKEFKVVINTAAVVPSNNLFGISLRNGGDPRVLAAWLRSGDGQTELLRLSRRYPGGSYKLEPRALGAVRLPVGFADFRK